ncbi:hypothetical protein SDC9_203604 [bioreactor metagenome]|uniref:Uncharacterized protein n=1 Tax=bioreactor metagenome TaxID=1076179 RepID=A0A645IYF0_9ZZZZ
MGIDLAPAVITAAAGAITLIFGTLGHGTEIGDIQQGAVSTILAVVGSNLEQVLQAVFFRIFHSPVKTAHHRIQVFIRRKKNLVHEAH